MSFEAMAWARKVGMTAQKLGELNSGAVFVLWSLADRADENWSCYPSVKYDLAPSTMQNERSTKRHLVALRQAGLLATEARTGADGRRTGLRFYLLREGLEALEQRLADMLTGQGTAAQEAPETRSDKMSPLRETPSQSRSDILALQDSEAGEIRSDILSPLHEMPSQSRSDNLSLGNQKGHFRQARSDNFDTKSSGAFKRNARALNHQSINHQWGAGSWDEADLDWSVPEEVLAFGELVSAPVDDDRVMDGSIDDSRSEETDPAPSEQTSSVEGRAAALISDVELAELVHRGVRLEQLAEVGAARGLVRDRVVWREVVDIVLNRAVGTVGNPTKYLVGAMEREAVMLVAEAVSKTYGQVRSVDEPVVMIECKKHYWSGREGSVCPSCRADRLAGEPVEEEPVRLTNEQVQQLPEEYRAMTDPGFGARYRASQAVQSAVEHEDEGELVGVAPWDL